VSGVKNVEQLVCINTLRGCEDNDFEKTAGELKEIIEKGTLVDSYFVESAIKVDIKNKIWSDDLGRISSTVNEGLIEI